MGCSGCAQHGRMCVGVLTVLKIGHAWETTDKLNACVCLCLCQGRACECCLTVSTSDTLHESVWQLHHQKQRYIERRDGKNVYVCVTVCTVNGLGQGCMIPMGIWGSMLQHTHKRYAWFLNVCVRVCVRAYMHACVCVCMCVCVQPCLQGEVEADALAAGLARLSGPNL